MSINLRQKLQQFASSLLDFAANRKDALATINSMIISISLLCGGVWAVSTFRSTRQSDKANIDLRISNINEQVAKLTEKKTIIETEIAESSKDRILSENRPIVSTKIDIQQLPSETFLPPSMPKSNEKFMIFNISITNNGKGKDLVLNLAKNLDFYVMKVMDVDVDGVVHYDGSSKKKISFLYEYESIETVIVRPFGDIEHLISIQKLLPGNYLVKFRTEDYSAAQYFTVLNQ